MDRAWSPLKRRTELVSLSGHSVGEGGELERSFWVRSHWLSGMELTRTETKMVSVGKMCLGEER